MDSNELQRVFRDEDFAFHTIASPTQVEITIKKSRFIGTVRPIQTVDEAEAVLAELRETHKAANHNCFAWRVGMGVPVERFSDDGEPSGTAGRPILEVLRRRPVLNVIAIVTRYFGGTLLGANGLVRAYADATSAALDEADWLACGWMRQIGVQVDYSTYGKLEYELAQQGVQLLDKVYAEDVRFTVWVPSSEAEGMEKQLADWSSGQAHCDVSEAQVVGVRPDGSFVFDVMAGD